MNINATEQQLALIAEGKITLCEVLEKQPPKGFTERNQGVYIGNMFVEFSNGFCSDDFKARFWRTKLRYPVGTVIGVKKKWKIILKCSITHRIDIQCFGDDTTICLPDKYLGVYECKYERPHRIGYDKHWRSSATMPSEAIRTKLKVVGSRVCKVQDVFVKDLESITNMPCKLPDTTNLVEAQGADINKINGFMLSTTQEIFKQWLNAKYAKPRPRRKNGEIVGYECWAWDTESVERFVCETCGGDGKETCNNPDHGGIESGLFGRDNNRLGCPVCGHNENHKVSGGGDCFDCEGTGYTWNDKPLIIHVDSYVELTKCEVQ